MHLLAPRSSRCMGAEMANHPVAPGISGFNLLSKRHVFRVVLLKGTIQRSKKPLQGPLVLESEDGSYRFEYPFCDAVREGDHLVFEFYLGVRNKKYTCYIKDGSGRKVTWSHVPKRQIQFNDIDKQNA